MSRDEDAQRVAFAQAMKRALEDFVQTEQMVQLEAKIAYARYKALIKEGFSEGHALYLCTRKVEI